MRPRRPYITTLADVTISRSGESAVITYGDPAVRPVVFAIGPDIDRCSDAEILARFNDSLYAARAKTEGRQHVVVEIPRGYPQLVWTASRDKVTYLVKAPAGVLAGSRCARTCDGMARRTHRDNRRACKRRNVSSASGMSASSGNG